MLKIEQAYREQKMFHCYSSFSWILAMGRENHPLPPCPCPPPMTILYLFHGYHKTIFLWHSFTCPANVGCPSCGALLLWYVTIFFGILALQHIVFQSPEHCIFVGIFLSFFSFFLITFSTKFVFIHKILDLSSSVCTYLVFGY